MLYRIGFLGYAQVQTIELLPGQGRELPHQGQANQDRHDIHLPSVGEGIGYRDEVQGQDTDNKQPKVQSTPESTWADDRCANPTLAHGQKYIRFHLS